MSTPEKSPPLLLAFDDVAQLARQGVLEAEDPGMEYEAARQAKAVDMFDDFVANLGEDMDGILEARGGVDGLRRADGSFPDLDLDEVRGIAADPEFDAFSVTLELAAQQIREGEVDEAEEIESDGETMAAGEALDLVGAFWERCGAEISEKVTTITLPDDFFDAPDDATEPEM